MTDDVIIAHVIALVPGFLFLPLALRFSRFFGLYSIVNEREAQVFTLFGRVLGTLDEPGIRFPIGHFGLMALLVPFFGERHKVDTCLRQSYLRDQMVDNITDKVVKRLVQVTSAMKQDGENRVGLIKSQTAYKVSQKMAEASATRPAVVGDVLNAVAKQDPEVLDAVLEVMEVDRLMESGAGVDVVPADAKLILSLTEAED